MAQLVVRNIDDRVKARLQRRAKQHGRSMEEEVREILRDAVKQEQASQSDGLGTRMAKIFQGCGIKELPELHMEIKPARFEP